MNFFPIRGRAGRASGSSRRRLSRFAPMNPEPLESRALLAAGSFGINIDINPYGSLVNWLQISRGWNDIPGTTTPIVLNASGDPESDTGLIFDYRVNEPWNGPDPNAVAPNLSGTYSLTFNGQATIQNELPGFSTPFTVQNQTYDPTTNTTTASLVVPANYGSEFMAIEFLNTQATPTSGLNTGLSNARLIRPGYAADTTQIYTNEFLAALKPFSTIRYAGPDAATSQPFLDKQNNLVTVNASQVDQTGMPWEYQIALANATNTDMWINIPEGATNDYVTALAGIFKNGGTVNGVTYPGLNPNLKIYIEYSNEVWGGTPPNLYYQQVAVQNKATNTPLSTFPSNLDLYTNPDGSAQTDLETVVGRRYLERTNDISLLFQSVLGADSTHQKLRPVLGWQENNTNFWPGAMSWFEHFFGSASTAFYGMGNANYWSPTDYSSVNSVIASLTAQEATYAIPNTVDFTTLATFYGLKNVSYEGGPAITGNSTTTDPIALAASRDPRMEQLVYQHYLNYYANGGTLADHENGPYGTWSPANEWDIAELGQYGNPTSAAKYRGTVDVGNAAPVPVTAGIPISATAATNFVASKDTLGTNYITPTTGQQAFWLLNVATAGTYDLQVATSGLGGLASGQVDVYLNDTLLGGPINVSASGQVDLGNLPLQAGLNVLSIITVHGLNDPSMSTATYYRFQPTQFTITPAGIAPPPQPMAIPDGSFETIPVGLHNAVYNPTGSPWTFSSASPSGSGVSGNNSVFTSSLSPQGSQVAFIQEKGTITQAVPGWAAGSYTLSFDAAQRTWSATGEDFEVLVDGNAVGIVRPSNPVFMTYSTSVFTVTAGTHTIEFLGLDTAGGDNTAFIDAVSAYVAVPSATTVQPVDAGFENVVVGKGSAVYNPAGSAWTFSGAAPSGSGVSGNLSVFTSSPSPQGSQVAFIQEKGSITQAIVGWAAGTYSISFDAAQRNRSNSAEDFQVLVDGIVVGTFKPSGLTYLPYVTSAFTVSAGAHTIQFLGLDTVGGDNTAFIDAVSISLANPTTTKAEPADPSFENYVVGKGNAVYNPTGSAWNFSAWNGTGGSGVSGNNSVFTSAPAPQGLQVAFLQEKGTITQAVAGWAAGSYTISFDAALRYRTNSAEDFQVLVDGIVVGTFKPTGFSYLLYSTATFTVSAGTHTIEFLGLNTVGGDNTAFIDAVSIN